MCNEEWRYLHDLLQNGYPYLEALQLLGKDTTRIREQLELGHSIEEILITQGTGRFFEHLSFFLKITSLSRKGHQSFDRGADSKQIGEIAGRCGTMV